MKAAYEFLPTVNGIVHHLKWVEAELNVLTTAPIDQKELEKMIKHLTVLAAYSAKICDELVKQSPDEE